MPIGVIGDGAARPVNPPRVELPAVDAGRIAALDGLRAVGIAGVLLAHATTTYHFPAQALLRRPFGVFGVLGVEIFFVLSGFLITRVLLREADVAGRVNLKHFYLRRALRILPVFLCLVATLVVLRLYGFVTIRQTGWVELATFTVNFEHSPRWSMGHLWFLAIEVHFYLLFPPLLRWLAPRAVVRVLAGTILFGIVARWAGLVLFRHDPVIMEMIEYTTFTRLDSLAAGCLLAFAARDPLWRGRLDAVVAHRWAGYAAAAGVAAVMVASARVWWFLPAAGHTALALLLPLLVWASVRRTGGLARAVLCSRPMVLVGLSSYSIYLWQQLFLFKDRRGPLQTFPQNILFCLAVSFCSYLLVERPFLAMKQRFAAAG